MDIIIRQETADDYNVVNKITELAFEHMPFADGDEHILVQQLRKEENFIKELSLVAEIEGMIKGHILFSPIIIQNKTNSFSSLMLAPVSVHPEFQKKGIGSKLIIEGHTRAKKLGYTSVVVLGHPEYYPKFGYTPAGKWKICMPFNVPEEAFMALEMVRGALNGVSGTVSMPKPFG